MNEELGEESRARSNSEMVDGRESSMAVAARSTAPDLLDLDFFREEDASASSADDSSDADGAGEGARPDQSNPPDTFRADAAGLVVVLDFDLDAMGLLDMST
jgi:hypothetical protein